MQKLTRRLITQGSKDLHLLLRHRLEFKVQMAARKHLLHLREFFFSVFALGHGEMFELAPG